VALALVWALGSVLGSVVVLDPAVLESACSCSPPQRVLCTRGSGGSLCTGANSSRFVDVRRVASKEGSSRRRRPGTWSPTLTSA
jgi:hypothetical protein